MKESPYLLRAADVDASAQTISHPWNPLSEIHGTMLARTLGLTRTGVSLARIGSGKESFVYHSHRYEEEWMYILSGKGVAEIDGHEYEVGPGDFMAFPAPSVAHHLRNPFAEDLVYLMGGESRRFEIADFPKIRKRMIRDGADVQVYDAADGRPFGQLEELDE
jgi:uncharacterized cupin superfamily protein